MSIGWAVWAHGLPTDRTAGILVTTLLLILEYQKSDCGATSSPRTVALGWQSVRTIVQAPLFEAWALRGKPVHSAERDNEKIRAHAPQRLMGASMRYQGVHIISILIKHYFIIFGGMLVHVLVTNCTLYSHLAFGKSRIAITNLAVASPTIVQNYWFPSLFPSPTNHCVMVITAVWLHEHGDLGCRSVVLIQGDELAPRKHGRHADI